MKTTISVATARDFFSDEGRNIHSKNIYSVRFSIYRHDSLTKKMNCYFFVVNYSRVYPMETSPVTARHSFVTALDGQISCQSTQTVSLLSAYIPVRWPCGISDDVYETSAQPVIFPNIRIEEPAGEIRLSPFDTGFRPYRNVPRIKRIHADVSEKLKKKNPCQTILVRLCFLHFCAHARSPSDRRKRNEQQNTTRTIIVRQLGLFPPRSYYRGKSSRAIKWKKNNVVRRKRSIYDDTLAWSYPERGSPNSFVSYGENQNGRAVYEHAQFLILQKQAQTLFCFLNMIIEFFWCKILCGGNLSVCNFPRWIRKNSSDVLRLSERVPSTKV